MGNITLAMIKPDAVEANNIGQIIQKYTEAGFKIRAMKMTKLSEKQAQAFYAVHKERPFFNDLVKFMTRGKIVALSLEKENAVEDYRLLIGATDPAEAKEGTIRKLFGKSKEENAVHGSDSDENAIIETNFFFSASEIAELVC
jgi:nucleoside-diphosphate kinase